MEYFNYEHPVQPLQNRNHFYCCSIYLLLGVWGGGAVILVYPSLLLFSSTLKCLYVMSFSIQCKGEFHRAIAVGSLKVEIVFGLFG